MARVSRLFTVSVLLVAAAAAAAAAQPLKPEWSRPVGGRARFVGVEEYGRCSVFVDNGVIQVVTPAGQISWTWPFSKISKYINPREVAVSHDCDAIAFVGDASYKYVWIVDRAGTSASLKLAATPADVEFDRKGALVAVGTYAGSLFLYSRNGTLQWKRETKAAIVSDLEFTDDNQQIIFKGWAGAGVVSTAGEVRWSMLANRLAAARDLGTFVMSQEPNHGPGLPSITVTDHKQSVLWSRWGSIEAFVSDTGHRVLAVVDRNQDKKEADFFGEAQAADVQLLSRGGDVIATFSDYRRPVAISEDGDRMWLGREGGIDCVDVSGQVLASIDATHSARGVRVSRDFTQVLIVTEKDLHAVSVARYAVPPPCGR